MGANGTAILDFGSAPGTNHVMVTVNSAGILSSSIAEAWKMAESTATHNSIEHILVPLDLSCEINSNGGSFIIHAVSELRLTGTFQVHWVWL